MNQQTTRIAFCITCKGRVQHIRATLPKNLVDNLDYENAVFVLLNYNSPDDLIPYVYANHMDAINSGKLVVYNLVDAGTFRMAHAKNLAHRLGIKEGADILVNMDADNFTGPGFASYIAEQFERLGPHIFLWGRMIKRCNLECPDGGICVLPRDHQLEHSSSVEVLAARYPESEHPLNRGVSGRIVVPTQAFLKVGGYDEKYLTWGPDDKDFNTRLQMLGYVPHEIDRKYLGAIHHSEKLRFKEYPEAQPNYECIYDEPIDINPYTAVVNFGKFGEGTVLKNCSLTSITLGRVPTRVFGIGMQKTATTSLSVALRILGFDSGHWENPRWARNIWEEMAEHEKSLTLEKYYAVSDFPIAILYQQLDVSYPGSKFILTVRDENDWLESVRNHWGYENNRWRSEWDSDCFSHKMHTIVYGRKKFDADIFLARYRRHNEEVKAYFKDRPNDLLVIDVDKNPGWPKLCAFLDKPIPDVRYPRRNVSPIHIDHVKSEVYWLIECGTPTSYFCRDGDWCSNPNHALRFINEDEAKTKALSLTTTEPCRVCDHIWNS